LARFVHEARFQAAPRDSLMARAPPAP
jgi:hypothetical protein